MSNATVPQENKAEILEQAVINGSLEELVKTYKELGYIEMTARALGLACRFCGAELVRGLIGLGATFDFPKSEELEKRYHVYSGMKYHNYRTDFSLYLLNITKQIKGACCCKGLKLSQKAARPDKTALRTLPDSERGEVLRILCENAEKISFEPSEMLYYAIFARDEFIVKELEKLGVRLSENRIKYIANGGPISDSYWYEWLSMTGKLENEDYLPVMKRVSAELGGKPFHCTGKLYDITKKRFADTEIFGYFLDNFKLEKLNKSQVIRELIDSGAVGALSLIEKTGWLNEPKRREEAIAYAQSRKDRVECVAWLLDFKNRTADLAAERFKAEKKLERELNASPNSVASLRKIWSFGKRADGGLRISNYKGNSTEVEVPETIGKSTVVEIGAGAFVGSQRGLYGNPYCSFEQLEAHRDITKITLPETVRVIGEGAFADMASLTEINIPSGVTEIGKVAFYHCVALCELVIPKTVRIIGEFAFNNCNKLTVVVQKKSYAEEYCRKNGVRYKYKEKL